MASYNCHVIGLQALMALVVVGHQHLDRLCGAHLGLFLPVIDALCLSRRRGSIVSLSGRRYTKPAVAEIRTASRLEPVVSVHSSFNTAKNFVLTYQFEVDSV